MVRSPSLVGLGLALLLSNCLAVDNTFVYDAELHHEIGQRAGDGWAASTSSYGEGFLVNGPYVSNWGEGGGRAIFQLMVNDNSANNVELVTVDVCDSTDLNVIATRTLRRREFDTVGTYQDFDLWFDTKGIAGHTMETRVYWHDAGFVQAGTVTVEMDYFREGYPRINNKSGSSDEKVQQLVQRAIDGLGFNSRNYDAPNKDDLVFVGKYYMSWIDQTGFYGKMNAMWVLNGEEGDNLDFVLLDGSRPVSAFAVAEDGDGKWLDGYHGGAEHYEIPHEIAEPDFQIPGITNGEGRNCFAGTCLLNWYSMNEADRVIDPDAPWWSVCGPNSISWIKKIMPVHVEETATSLKLIYEGPITKEADGDLNRNGDFCHADYLFTDGQRRRVNMRVGYELHGDMNYFDRTYQILNPTGNPAFGHEAWSVIGGIILTKYPNFHPMKEIKFVRPEERDVTRKVRQKNILDLWAILPSQEKEITFGAGQWRRYDRDEEDDWNMDRNIDDVWGWLDQPMSWSTTGSYSMGRSLTMSHVGPSDNADVGFCYCNVHNGFEIGGGVLHKGDSLPIDGGSSTIVSVRRVTLPMESRHYIYEAENAPELRNGLGRSEGDGWSASTGLDSEGFLIVGPFLTEIPEGRRTAIFAMMIDEVNDSEELFGTDLFDFFVSLVPVTNSKVVRIDVFDWTNQEVLATRDVKRHDFDNALEYQEFLLEFDMTGRAGSAIETRVYWMDKAFIKVDRIEIF